MFWRSMAVAVVDAAIAVAAGDVVNRGGAVSVASDSRAPSA